MLDVKDYQSVPVAPTQVSAVLVDGTTEQASAIVEWTKGVVQTPEGRLFVQPGDWLVFDKVTKVFSSCGQSEFAARYVASPALAAEVEEALP